MLRLSVLASSAIVVFAVGSGPNPARAVGPHPERQVHSSAATFSLAARVPALSNAHDGALADVQWTDQVFTAATGEPVDVSVSSSYAADDGVGQRWADFFASLLHGPELQLLKAYVAPLPEVQTICGTHAVGCYGDDRLFVTNEPALGFAPEEVARHEYGHHIARNRTNAPWPAIDWGPKYWATGADVCARVRSGSAYPGDEFLLYKLNPGEAFAEAYRVLIDIRLGQTQPSWPLVDSRFFPDQAGLSAIERDVLSPWSGPTTRTLHVRVPDGSRSVWTRRVSTPLDGTLTLRLAVPAGVKGHLALLADDGRTVLAAGESSRGQITLTYKVCGQRSLVVRLSAPDRGGRRLDLQVTTP